MEYPAINLSLEALKAREGKPLNDCDLAEFKFQDLNELAEILVNQSDLTAEAFYYPDALATCGEIEEELATDGMTCNWKDQMIISEFTGRHPARARVCYYYPKDAEAIKAIAVLRDGTTIADFRPLQNK